MWGQPPPAVRRSKLDLAAAGEAAPASVPSPTRAPQMEQKARRMPQITSSKTKPLVETLLATSLSPRAISGIMASTYHLNDGLRSLMTLFQAKYRIESTRLQDWDYRSRGWYFVTICTQRRRPILGQIVLNEVQLSQIGLIADSELRTPHDHYRNVHVDEHIVMPNHVHAIFMIDGEHYFSPDAKVTVPSRFRNSFTSPRAGSLSAIVRSYKAGVTRRCRELGLQQDLWQPRFYNHLLRGDKFISAVREYIRNNPANWPKDIENRL